MVELVSQPEAARTFAYVALATQELRAKSVIPFVQVSSRKFFNIFYSSKKR